MPAGSSIVAMSCIRPEHRRPDRGGGVTGHRTTRQRRGENPASPSASDGAVTSVCSVCTERGVGQSRSSFGIFPPFSASFCRTVLCSHMFICAESPIFSAGHPSSVASPLRAARLLSSPSSYIRSTIEGSPASTKLTSTSRSAEAHHQE